MSRRKEPAIPAELLDQLLAGTDGAAALDQGGLLASLKKALAERALNAEMDHHLGLRSKSATAATAMAARPSSPIPARS
jgi:transposase-like protein